ncbi:MAG: type I methionyl aminopeptidase [Clostridia bacterium]|nr:type I methionyl aminopeptidase [Clostridia bacterium]MBO7318832.1 type I methionyl aminopeptidase [Clostridia bacterium]
MVVLKTRREIELMREAGRIAATALKVAGEAVRPGVSTLEIDTIARKYIESQGARPNFLGLYGFPATACISINNEVIHGIPSKDRILKEGDIVSIDLGAEKNGYHGDNAATFAVGEISDEAKRLIDTTRESLYVGLKQAVAGNRIGDISNAVQMYCEERGYGVVRDFVGHGIGKELHEDPSVPNFGTPGRGVRLLPGMTIAVEPMINQGTWEVNQLSDGWTIVTKDGKLAAHFEHTIAITKDGECMILTLPD